MLLDCCFNASEQCGNLKLWPWIRTLPDTYEIVGGLIIPSAWIQHTVWAITTLNNVSTGIVCQMSSSNGGAWNVRLQMFMIPLKRGFRPSKSLRAGNEGG